MNTEDRPIRPAGRCLARWAAVLVLVCPPVQLLAAQPVPESCAARQAQMAAKLERQLELVYQARGAAGGSAALATPDGCIVAAAAGYADMERREVMRSTSRLLAGSVGKTFVGAAALHLVHEGKADLDVPVTAYFSDRALLESLPNGTRVTLRQLLAHRSGIPNHVQADRFVGDVRADAESLGHVPYRTPYELLAYLNDVSALCEPDECFHYSDSNYLLAGLVIEAAAGESFYGLTERLFLRRLDLHDVIASDRPAIEQLANGYLHTPNPYGLPRTSLVGNQLVFHPGIEWTGGGFASTASDLARWVLLLGSGKAMTHDYLSEMLSTEELPTDRDYRYGLGLQVRQTAAGRSLGHLGFMPGYSSAALYFPDHGIAVALMLNQDNVAGMGEAAGDLAVEFIAANRSGSSSAALVTSTHGYDLRAHYERAEHDVTMRDGVRLHTVVYRPREGVEGLPVLLLRTPYELSDFGIAPGMQCLGPGPGFEERGYIFVHQYVRGRYKSEGVFDIFRPLSSTDDPESTDESTDAYDTIEWIVRELPANNGRVGQWGISYMGWQAAAAMVRAHPSLLAVSPQASPADVYAGDDFFRGGAFRLLYAFNWISGYAHDLQGLSPLPRPRLPWAYQTFRELGTIRQVTERLAAGGGPVWRAVTAHGLYDEFWQSRNILPHMNDIRPAVLNVAGWFDAENFYGSTEIYRAIESSTPGNRSRLIIGPWRHGGWILDDGASLGDMHFDEPTSERLQQIQLEFFASHLEHGTDWSGPEVLAFITGANQWRELDQWPPAATAPLKLYLAEEERLEEVAPSSRRAADRYLSNPRKPVPFSAEITDRMGWRFMTEDQRFAYARPDVLTYQSEPLTDDVMLAGEAIATLYFSTSGTDADVVVKLIDTHPQAISLADDPHGQDWRPGGHQLLLTAEILRAKFRDSWSQPKALRPGEVHRLEVRLPGRMHVFRKGHRIMVQVQSSWFPLYDANPQTFTDIFSADLSQYRPAEHVIHRSRAHPSHITLPVLALEQMQ